MLLVFVSEFLTENIVIYIEYKFIQCGQSFTGQHHALCRQQ